MAREHDCPDAHALLGAWEKFQEGMPGFSFAIREAFRCCFFAGADHLGKLVNDAGARAAGENPEDALALIQHVLMHAKEDIDEQMADAQATAVVEMVRIDSRRH